jgi:hypothetical protein
MSATSVFLRPLGIVPVKIAAIRARPALGLDWARLVLMMSIIAGMDTSSPLDRPAVGACAPTLRARVTNHKDLLPGLDGR